MSVLNIRKEKKDDGDKYRTSGWSGDWWASDGQDAKTSNCFHFATTLGIGESIQDEQVSFQTKEVRGGHQSHAHRNTGTFTKFNYNQSGEY